MNIQAVIFAALVMVLIMKTDAAAPRGIRNNNPGNIRHSSAEWVGASPNQTDSAFVQFVSPEYGIRALAKLLINYEALYGLRTVAGLISRYAPGSENNTAAYIAYVAAALGVDPAEPLSVYSRLDALVAAIVSYENGIQPYSSALISRGIGMVEAA